MKRTINLFFLSVMLLYAGCDLNTGGAPDSRIPQTEILGFRFDSADTVQAGDMLRITCVIADSADTTFRLFGI